MVEYKKGDILTSTDSRLYVLKNIPDLEGQPAVEVIELFEISPAQHSIMIIPIHISWIKENSFALEDKRYSTEFKRTSIKTCFEGINIK
jgi:hypothetical protein